MARNYIGEKFKGKGEAPQKNKILVTETDLHICQNSNNSCQFKGRIDGMADFCVVLNKDDINLIENGMKDALSVDPNHKLAITWASVKKVTLTRWEPLVESPMSWSELR